MQKMVNSDRSLESSSATSDEASNNDNEKIRLQRQIRDLESELVNTKRETRSKEQMLYNLLKEEVSKCLKLNVELVVANREHNKVENELKQTHYKKRSADSTVQRARDSENDLSKIAAADRSWLEAEMSRRSTITLETRKKSESELARIRRRISTQW